VRFTHCSSGGFLFLAACGAGGSFWCCWRGRFAVVFRVGDGDISNATAGWGGESLFGSGRGWRWRVGFFGMR
jgi:hypothetical protein